LSDTAASSAGKLRVLLSCAAAAGLALSAAAPAALAQSAITVERRGGSALPVRFTVELSNEDGFHRGRAALAHPGTFLPEIAGTVPAPLVDALATAASAADLFSQPADAWSEAIVDGAARRFSDEDGSWCTLHASREATTTTAAPEMEALARAMADAERAFRPAPPRAARKSGKAVTSGPDDATNEEPCVNFASPSSSPSRPSSRSTDAPTPTAAPSTGSTRRSRRRTPRPRRPRSPT
jgi:hypothetical protein